MSHWLSCITLSGQTTDDLGSGLPLWSGKVIKMCKEEKEIFRLLS